MASRRIKLTSAAAAVTLLAAGYFLYSVFAVQGQGALAQAPLNTQVQVPPGFIMALDDSGSMLWETLNNTRDGVYGWSDSNKSFYDGNVPRGYDGVSQRYYYTFPPYGRGENAIPPIDAFGFARSPDVNPGYFDPRVTYPTWKDHEGNDYVAIDPTDAPVDPRPAGAPGKDNSRLNLTNEVDLDSNNWRFRVRSGMRLPAGITVRGSCNANPSNLPSSWLTLSEEREIRQSCLVAFEYFPATFFLEDPASLPISYGYSSEPIEVTDPPGGMPGTLYKYEIKEGNFVTPDAYAAAIQNFAHWFSFYRTRREALIGGAVNALVDVNNLRVGWFRINSRNNVTMYDMGEQGDKETLFDEIFSNMRASGSTPNRRAVRHLGEQFKRSSGGNLPVVRACQKNAGMLFTDGYINDSDSPSPGNLDGSRMPGAPFADGVSHTVADIVVPYYLDSLRPDLESDDVPVPAGCSVTNPAPHLDCQTNLHMNFYAVTLGTLGEMYGVSYVPDEFQPWKTHPDPYDNPPVWANSRLDLHPRAVDELWHATINSRGEMINATRPTDIVAAIRRILISVSAGASPSGTLSLTGSRIGTGSLSVEPFYEVLNEGTDWYSHLTAYSLAVDPAQQTVVPTEEWEASEELPVAAAREIWVGKNGNVVPFETTYLAEDDLCTSPAAGMSRCAPYASHFGSGGTRIDITFDEAVSYLRGDTTLELQNGGKLRDRTSRLGDIVNSTPVVSAPTDDYGYRSLSDTAMASSYQSFLDGKRSDRRVMVYAGANDGMLHAFDGGMGADGEFDSNGGRERFAYIPESVLGHMGNLLFPYDPEDEYDQKFQHRYYVDGPLAVGDAHYDDSWGTVLVGTTGAGGRGVFALDVSAASTALDPNPFSSSSRLWEINSFDTALHANVRDHIGFVLGRPVIVPFKTTAGVTSFKAIFGNGYNSSSGKAVLFVVDIDRGSPTIRMIEADEDGAPAGSNGLGNLVVVDRWGGADLTSGIRDGFADTVYAADQKGAVWKFDLRNDLPASANDVGRIETPLFTTREHEESGQTWRQPILGGLTAAAGPGGGTMVFFGTGSFSFVNDPADTSIQSIYGVLDRGPVATLTRDNLLEQTVGTADGGVRQVSQNLLGAADRGWYVDLPAGERAVGYPRVESGVLFIPTYSPDAESGCSTDGFNSLFGLNALSGAAGLSNVRQGTPDGESFDQGTGAIALNTGGTAPVKDVQVMTAPRVPPLAAGSDPADLETALDAQCNMVVQVAGAESLYLPRACGRQSWRQIQ